MIESDAGVPRVNKDWLGAKALVRSIPLPMAADMVLEPAPRRELSRIFWKL
jgi:hypothetical protein